MAGASEMGEGTGGTDLEISGNEFKSSHLQPTAPALKVNGTADSTLWPTPRPGLDTSSMAATPPARTPRDGSPDKLTPLSTTSRASAALKSSMGHGPRLTAGRTNDQSPSPLVREPTEADSTLNGAATPTPRRKSVQFSRDTQEVDGYGGGQSTPPADNAERGDQTRVQSLYSKLKALANSQGLSHSRSPSGISLGARSLDGKDFGGHFSSIRSEPGLHATVEEDSDADDADAEESAAEGVRELEIPRKRRRKVRRFDEIETAPSSPHSLLRSGFGSAPVHADLDRPQRLVRRATETDMAHHGRQGMSEDEGRHHLERQATAWTPRHPLRGLSYASQRKISEGAPDGREGRRTLTSLNFSHPVWSREAGAPAADGQTPKTSRRKMMAERGSTLSAAKWRQLKNSLRLLGQSRKKERTPDHEKSAELMAELAAGTPAALILASMFQRDEHNNRRIPVLLEQLKVQITDSEVDKYKETDVSTQSDRHLIFRIELEYGNGINRMRWVVKRSLRDFANLHLKYKLHYSSEKLKGRGGDSGKQMPKFPRSAFPYLKSFRGLDDEEEEEDEHNPVNHGNNNDEQESAPVTDNERPAPRIQHRSSFGLGRQRTGIGGFHDMTMTGAAGKRDTRYAERQRKSLEHYLQKMIKFMLFRPESNRLCKFLEVSALGMRLAAEGSYHGKEGYLLIQSAKGLDFRKALTPANVTRRHSPKWFLVRHSYVVCVDSPEEMHIYDVFLFDADFAIQSSKQRSRDQTRAQELAEAARESAKHPQHHRLKLVNSERKLKLLARNERQLHQFEESIRLMIAASPWARTNRFDSFAPVRPNCFAQWLVDGRDHMWVVSRALNQAKDVIYIHDWWLSPELYMRRPPAISQKWRLDRLLKRKAEEGVKIFVIVYRNIESAIPIDSQYTKFSLLDLHPNIFVQRSPNQFRQNTFFWAHHEKICIVDHTLAFVGGVDLCFGRWDTPQHPLVDDKPTGFEPSDHPKDADHCQLWPGKDYSNPRIQDFYALNKPYEEMYDRQRVCRMPWHDISMQVVGQPARDLTRHFVQRWNYILRQRKPTRPTPFLLPPPDFNPADLEALGLDGTCEVQILRSAGPWSLGTPEKTEHSIMNAYIKLIEESEHFVYIENQFFISSCETEGVIVHNKIGDALVERITRASKNDDPWRACIIIPLIPGFQNTVEQEGGTSVRLIMQYQYRSICRGESSIFGRLRSLGIEPEDYVQFYSLRQWGRIGPRRSLVTEQLYIHAKCMVVDDRVAIIGSANINERSLLGNRDSECAAVVRDTDTLWSRMNGKPYQVGRFPHTLRMRLMREHLGLDVDKIMEDAQVTEAEHRKSELAAQGYAFEDWSNPMSATISPLDRRAPEIREELLQRSEELRSFNHDVDWEQADNPNLKANRKLTEDPRVTGNATHRQDVQGHGLDHMTEIEDSGYGVGRDTTVVKDNKEVLIANLDTEGKAPLQSPRKRGETTGMPKPETLNPPLPPKPLVSRMNTELLGLPMLSQLPALPLEDDTDIGGPSLARATPKDTGRRRHPLMSEIKRPLVDPDCMSDPIHDAFLYDIWHAVAEDNTKIYRTVFRCMPDNLVRDWNEYHQYLAYEQRFNQMQGNDLPTDDKGPHPARTGAASKSGPPGAGSQAAGAQIKALIQVPADIEKKTSDLKDKVMGARGEKGPEATTDPEKEKLRLWAAEANQAQAERQKKASLHQHESLVDEKAGLAPVPEGQILHHDDATATDDEENTERATSSPSSSTAVEKEKATPPSTCGQAVGSSDPSPPNGAATVSTAAAPKTRRRAATRSSRREFSASDDILSSEDAEELLGCVQGHLVLWPYDW